MRNPSRNLVSGVRNAYPGGEPIAIVGLGCRFPRAATAGAFWSLLVDETDAIGDVPPGRFVRPIGDLFDPRPGTPGRIASRWGGFVDDIEGFDAAYFGMAPREADRLDPQQRLLLETAVHALDDAGHVPDPAARDRAGVFIGLWLNDYETRLFRDAHLVDFHATLGTGRYSASGRLSYAFGFEGPSLTVDTACSSSLVAVHLACQSLCTHECDVALAGGANVVLEPAVTIAYSAARMIAPDGRCKFGDARANGYVRSDGAGMVVLERLSTAIANGDRIYALIAGSAVNNDGRTSGSLGTPGRDGQERVLRLAYRNAGVSPGLVQYVEAHGTGTAVGDPTELAALGRVLGEGRPAGSICQVGSVKTNIGHTEGAAGIAGLIKVALSLAHDRLPASLHFQTPNPAVDWDRLPLAVPARTGPWPGGPDDRLAGVSALGIAGTNAHVVLRRHQASATTAAPVDAGPWLLPISAATPEALARLTALYAELLEASPDERVGDICYTAAVRRRHLAHRACYAGATRTALLAAIRRGASAGDEAATTGPLAGRYLGGETVDWSSRYPAGIGHLVALPSYPFDRVRHWYEAPSAAAVRASGDAQPAPAAPLTTRAADAPSPDPAPDIAGAWAATAPAERLDVLRAAVRAEVLRALGHSGGSAANVHGPLRDAGLDSVMAVELSARLGAGAGFVLSPTFAFDYPTIDDMTGTLAARLAAVLSSSGRTPAAPTTHGPPAAPAASDDEVRRLLAELDAAGY
jgi:myxalamid-type polyketide synthase MxaE and MxaD